MLVGASPKRKEDGRFVTGHGRYLDDVRVPGLLHLALVRSPHAHARVVSVDARAARALAGVVAVLTLDDLPELAAATVPPLVPEPKSRPYVHPVMAGARARHVGEIVAVVVAVDPYVAADGVERVAVAYEPLPAAVSAEAAAAPGAPRVNETWPDNLVSVTTSAKGNPERRAGRRRGGGVRAPGLSARGRDAARDARRAGRARSDRRRPHGVDLHPGALRGAQRHRAGGGPAGGAHPRDRARRGRRLRREGPRLPRGDPGARGGPAPRAPGEVGRDAPRALPHRGGRPRPGPRGADRAPARRPHRGHRHRVHPRSRRLAHARRGHHAQHHQSPARPLPRAELPRQSAGTCSPTRPSPRPTAAPAGRKPPSCWTGCWIARRGASAWTPPSCAGAT